MDYNDIIHHSELLNEYIYSPVTIKISSQFLVYLSHHSNEVHFNNESNICSKINMIVDDICLVSGMKSNTSKCLVLGGVELSIGKERKRFPDLVIVFNELKIPIFVIEVIKYNKRIMMIWENLKFLDNYMSICY